MLRKLCQFVPTRRLSVPGVKVPGIHEPEYLEDLKPKVGYYDLLNVQLKGYDFVVLEKYQSYVHRTMKKLGFQVTNSWATPCQEFQYEILGRNTTAVETTDKIKIYERNIQTRNALTTKLPILIDIMNITLPPSVMFNIDRHNEIDEDKRYFRDSVLENCLKELKELNDTPLIGT